MEVSLLDGSWAVLSTCWQNIKENSHLLTKNSPVNWPHYHMSLVKILSKWKEPTCLWKMQVFVTWKTGSKFDNWKLLRERIWYKTDPDDGWESSCVNFLINYFLIKEFSVSFLFLIHEKLRVNSKKTRQYLKRQENRKKINKKTKKYSFQVLKIKFSSRNWGYFRSESNKKTCERKRWCIKAHKI